MWDFEGPGVDSKEVKEATRNKRRMMLRRFRLSSRTSDNEQELTRQTSQVADDGGEKRVDAESSRKRSPSTSETGGLSGDQALEGEGKSSIDLEAQEDVLPLLTPSKSYGFVIVGTLGRFFKDLLTPISLSIFISFPVTLIPKLKALFVHVPGTQVASTPDGQPPLSFVLDATSFIGNLAIPLALICLGSSLARLHIPKKGEWKKLPLGAIGSLAVGKLIVMPIIGVFMCEGLTKVGFISKDDKVLRFICM